MRTLALIAALTLTACGTSDDTSSSDEPITLDRPTEGGEDTTEPAPDGLVIGDDACETDADCVPAGCCHSAACVATSNAPTCEEVMCTTDCQYGTLDCGGACLCHEGRCAARLSEPPQLRLKS
ncbi:MAG: hypothetical protein H6719_01065 [Sandaracinaceae bacterium]|nr:hypothetical protein [Sandaracinaceae bacterium]